MCESVVRGSVEPCFGEITIIMSSMFWRVTVCGQLGEVGFEIDGNFLVSRRWVGFLKDLSSTLQSSRRVRGRIRFFRIGAQMFAFDANFLFPTVNRSSCFAMAQCSAFGCSESVRGRRGACGCGGKMCRSR